MTVEKQGSTENNKTMFGSKINSKNRILRLVIALIVLLGTLTAVVWAIVYFMKDTGINGQSSVEKISTEVAIVEITESGLKPATISVVAGQSVKFINRDAAHHRLMADPELLHEFDSGIQLSTGDSYTYVFDTPGAYRYYDDSNPKAYTGTVEVQ